MVKYNHNEMAGREFKPNSEGYKWYLIANGSATMFCKLDEANYQLAKEQKPFEAWHMCIASQQGLAPLCINTKTLEPWLIGHYVSLSELHPTIGDQLEAAFEEMTRSVVVATTMPNIPIPKRPGKIELVN